LAPVPITRLTACRRAVGVPAGGRVRTRRPARRVAHGAAPGPPLRSVRGGPWPAIAMRTRDTMEPTEKRTGQAATEPPLESHEAPRDAGEGTVQEQIQDLQQELAALREERLRERADTENQRRRMQRE